MPSVLLIAPFFPPRRRVGALRPFRFVTHLKELGWRPAVVCLATPGATLTRREADRLSGIPRLELAVGPDVTRGRAGSDLEQTPRTAGGKMSGTPWRRTIGTLARGIDRWMPVDGWLPVLLAHAHRVSRFAQQHEIHVVWSTADPWSSHVLAGTVARRLGLPWVADFRDPWTLCRRRTADRPQPMLALDRRIERWIVESADRLVFTAERTTERYRDAYASVGTPMATIYNGFDGSIFTGSMQDRIESPRQGTRLDVLFFGKFRALSPARPVIEVLTQLRRRFPEAATGIRIQSMGPLEEDDRKAAEAAGVIDLFTTVASVPIEAALDRLREADVLLLSTAPERDEIIPAKLWDYLAAQRPVLSLAPNPEVETILGDVGAGYQVDPSGVDGLGRAAALLASAHQAKLTGDRIWPELPFRTDRLPEFDAPNTTAQLASLLQEVVER